MPTTDPQARDRLLAAVIVLATLIVYLPAMNAGFVWDDDIYVTESPLIAAKDGLYRLWFTTQHEAYYPLSSSTLWFEWRLWGMDARGYHVTNVVLHALNAVLIWRVLLQLKIPGAWVAALLFAVHPVNVASVAWISERKNVLSLYFYLLSVSWFLRFDAGASRRWHFLSLGAFLLALLSKTAVVMLPLVLLGCIWWRRGRITSKDFLRSAPYFALALTLGLVTVWFESNRVLGGKPVGEVAFWTRLAGAGLAPWFYLYKALLPFHLSMIYPRWAIESWGILVFLPGAALVIGLACCWRFRASSGRAVLFGAGYFVVTLFPVLGFFDVGFFAYSRVADHWQYASIIGIIALLVASGARLLAMRHLRWKVVAVAVPSVLLAALSFKQCGIYKDQKTLWRDTVLKNPMAWVAHYGLGVAAGMEGHFNEAVRHYSEALRLNSRYDKAHTNLGITFLMQGRTNDARAHFIKALELNPNSSKAHFNLGDVLAHEGKTEEAITHYRMALSREPGFASAHYRLAVALHKTGQARVAIEHFEYALRLRPDWPEALDGMARVLAADPSEKSFNPSKAVGFSTRACELTEGQQPAFLETLAVSLQAAGRVEEAVRVCQQALDLAIASGQVELVDGLRTRSDNLKLIVTHQHSAEKPSGD
jgi:tetratricopeptide (TPR) repeat protein